MHIVEWLILTCDSGCETTVPKRSARFFNFSSSSLVGGAELVTLAVPAFPLDDDNDDNDDDDLAAVIGRPNLQGMNRKRLTA